MILVSERLKRWTWVSALAALVAPPALLLYSRVAHKLGASVEFGVSIMLNLIWVFLASAIVLIVAPAMIGWRGVILLAAFIAELYLVVPALLPMGV
ncbi:hypothetical protein [Hansschlegelia zhihuaiae]|uniref:Uncharacterized protein n=1 Tax=Hansschlegelia zhihuaiae TaxID=405005 RepID=A0A4Q0M927_9HYPH|nr:hypothetical protein [Hansschlegelia zhihuaiae]RXF69236.1 hypothetical protein EK403_18800 [Hansschlegelia zhihuaiae]